MILTREDDERVREARAAILKRGGQLPAHRTLDDARRGMGANPAFIRVSDRYSTNGRTNGRS